ncbi:AAA family ATPase [Streptomyces sp. 7N604]|uniref:AAA family ATPase n=1 Tax=Streptomyces sp. 7N604 TaxID=3457415 RepID=UPI003FD5DEC1
MNVSTGLPQDGLGERLADTISVGALMSVTGTTASAAAAAVDGALDAERPIVRMRLGAAEFSVARPEFIRQFATELGLGGRETQPRRLADVANQVEDELARREAVLVVHGADRMLTEALEWLYSSWSRAAPAARLAVVFTGAPAFDRILNQPVLASLKSCIFIHHRVTA